MSIETILADWRFDMWTDIYQYPDAVALRHYNDARDTLIDAIIEEKEDYFYNYNQTTTVIWQNEYRLAKRWDLINWVWPLKLDWMIKVKGVSWQINSTDTKMTKLRPVSIANLNSDIETYDTTSTPFYCVLDNSIFIYPAPKEETPLKIYGITYPKKVELTDEEILPDQHIKTIKYWVKSMFLESQTRVNEAQEAQGKFEEYILKTCKALSWRVLQPVQRGPLNLNYLK